MHEVLLFYVYRTIEDPHAFAAWFRALAGQHALTGRVIIAEEGVNATLEGTSDQTDAFVTAMRLDPHLEDVSVKRSEGTGNAFAKLTVKVRPEIVGTKFPKDIDPRTRTAPRITAEQLREWYETGKEFEIVDMRNDYEYESGHFKGSVHPGIRSSRQLPDALSRLEPLKEKTVLTVCTGGVRCEKMSAYLLANGFENVYQLEDGMHGYMEKYPGKDFLGTLYTFDERLTMNWGGEREIIGRCYLCENPTETYVNCADVTCHYHFLACDACRNEAGTFCKKECRIRVLGETEPIHG